MKKLIFYILYIFTVQGTFAKDNFLDYCERVKKDINLIASEFGAKYDSIIVYSNKDHHLLITSKELYNEGKLMGLEYFCSTRQMIQTEKE